MTQQHPYTVMTVCTGNICRSPMAEIILRAEFESRGIGRGRVRVLSSGVSDEEYGHPIDPRAVRVLQPTGMRSPRIISPIASRARRSRKPTCSCR